MMTTEEQLADALAENARLRALLPPDLNDKGLVYRAGRCQKTNVYVHVVGDPDGYLLGKMPTPEAATHVIRALNAFDGGGEVSDGRKVLDLPMDGDYPTIRDYLASILAKLWSEFGPFTGKYGIGNIDWYRDLYAALVRAEMVADTFDEGGLLARRDEAEAHRLIAAAIAELAVAR